MSRMKSFFQRTVSAAAAVLNMPPVTLTPPPRYQVTNKAGKPGTPYRRIVQQDTVGPCHRQIGIKWLHGECLPLMQTYSVHSFLHATKGWRHYTQAMPRPGQQRKPNLPRNPVHEWYAHRTRRPAHVPVLGWRVVNDGHPA